MKTEILDAFFEGQTCYAYKVLGVQRTFENKEGYRFSVWAPNAKGVQLIYKNTSVDLDKIDARGIWSTFVTDIEVQDCYFYRIEQIDGNFMDKADPFAIAFKSKATAEALVVEREYDWKDQDWMCQRDKNFNKPVNIYEVYLNAVKEKAKYKDIAEELIAYCKSNQYTHIEFMPLHEHPYDGSWGYQVSGLYAITCRYGSLQDLKYLINRCHQENIGVIFDFVPIHFATDNFGLNKFDGTALYEYENVEDAYSEWGSANYNLGKEEVRSYLMSAAMYLIDELHADGLRIDAISHAIYWQGNAYRGENAGGLAFLKRMNYFLSKESKGVMLMAEDSTAYPNVTKPLNEGGLGFDYKWDMGWMNDTLRYMGKDPIYRKWHHHDITFSMAYFYNEKYVLPFSHDEVVHEKNTILNKMWGSFEDKLRQMRLLYTYMYTHPGKKLNFMGNEFASLKEFDETKEIEWDLLKKDKHQKFHTYIQHLSTLYKEEKALYENAYDYHYFMWIDADNTEENLYSYMLKSEDTTIITILNMSPVAYKNKRFGVEESGFYKLISSSEETRFGGNVEINKKMICAKKGECNYKPYYIEVDVDGFAGIIIKHTNKGRKNDTTSNNK